MSFDPYLSDRPVVETTLRIDEELEERLVVKAGRRGVHVALVEEKVVDLGA